MPHPASRPLRARTSARVPSVHDVLVLDRCDVARERLCEVLERLGFCTYPARNVAQATWLAQTRPFSAAFVDITFKGVDVGPRADLSSRVEGVPALPLDNDCALFILCDKPAFSDRVRAASAHCDAFLAQPASAGDIAGALESYGMVLPVDPRRS